MFTLMSLRVALRRATRDEAAVIFNRNVKNSGREGEFIARIVDCKDILKYTKPDVSPFSIPFTRLNIGSFGFKGDAAFLSNLAVSLIASRLHPSSQNPSSFAETCPSKESTSMFSKESEEYLDITAKVSSDAEKVNKHATKRVRWRH
jgi:hypothetical protein